ncbi:MAG TPA: PKD domain-containing protein, partial [Candidatus Aminicenantes bacterium]|nr:PKD domain-containing protein [Candidatus Aminicenantes bacterium]
MKSRLWIIVLVLLAASLTAQDAADSRRILVTPEIPRPGDPVVFTAEGFHTPEMLKWDLGDGTVLTVGQQLPSAEKPRITHVFIAAGTYTIRVFDWNGAADKPPVTRMLTVTVPE